MRNRNRGRARRGTGAVTSGSGQVTRPADPVTLAHGGSVVHRVVPAHLACRVGARARAGQRDAWPAVFSIALGTFALVFSELIPVGLLANISGHLRVSVGTGGLMVVVPAVAAAVAAPLLALCSARLERRRVLVGLSALVLVSDVIAGVAPGFGVMLAARAVLGVCVGGFWVFGAGAAITLVSERARGTAVAVPALTEKIVPCMSRIMASYGPLLTPTAACCYRPRYLNIQRLNYLWTIRHSSARIAGNLIT